jgi:hypothetical protein
MRHKSNAPSAGIGPFGACFCARSSRRQAIFNGVLLQSGAFTEYFRLDRIFAGFG